MLFLLQCQLRQSNESSLGSKAFFNSTISLLLKLTQLSGKKKKELLKQI